MSYSMDQWILFFMIYCFLGWIWECSYVSIRTRKPTNRGFMTGPVLPIYGFGAITMVFVGMPLINHPVLMFFAGLICASTLEYFTGDIMQRLFKVRYWDYSECFLNIKGHICLKASLAWGVFTLLMNYFAHKPIARVVSYIPENILHILVFILVILFVADYSLAFKTAMELRDVIISMERFKEELDRMERRLDVVIAFAEDSKNQAKEELITKIEDNTMQAKRRLAERIEEFENKVEEVREKLNAMELEAKEKFDNWEHETEQKRNELLKQVSEFRINSSVMKKRLDESANRRGVLYRHMIRSNPLVSDKFKDTLNEIKEKVHEYKK